MTRSEIIETFRAENKDIPSNVVSDALLYKWCKLANVEACSISRCIVGDTAFDSVVTSSVYLARYDLTSKISNFYDIDEFPGGGVSYDDDPLVKTTIAELDAKTPGWRGNTAGTPEKWYRRGKYLYFDRPVETAGEEIRVYAVLLPDDWDTDVEPFNELGYMKPYHYSINLYLTWMAKIKIGKREDSARAREEFVDYCKWMNKQLGGNKFGPITIRPR